MNEAKEITDVVVSKRGAKLTRRWNPKDWNPTYEAMVAMCVLGRMTQGDVAKHFGYTDAWLSQIMNSPKGREVQETLIRATRDKAVGNVTDRIRDLQSKALERMEAVLNDDKIAQKSALAIFDRSAYFLKNTGVIKDLHAAPVPSSGGVTNITQNNNTLIVSGKNADDLRVGLDKANQVRQIHAAPALIDG